MLYEVITPDHTPTHQDETFTFKDSARQKRIVYEYWGFWDIDNTGIVKPFVCAWIGNVIIRMEANPFPDQKLPS